MAKKSPLRLNLGSGSNKIPGYVNIDGEATCKPDVLHNILEKFPYKAGAAEEIVMFHCIEHIHRSLHQKLFTEIWRLLQPGGSLIISYPDFVKKLKSWGFGGIRAVPERDEKFNTIVSCVKAAASIGYEDLIRNDMIKH